MTELTLSPLPRGGSARIALRFMAMASLVLLAACALPRSGPSKKEIYRGSIENGGNAHILFVDDRWRARPPTPPATDSGRIS